MIDFRLILLVSACLGFSGLIVAQLYNGTSEPTATAATAPRPRAAPSTTRRQPDQPDDLVAAILARPLFSPSRRPAIGGTGDAGPGDLGANRLAGIVIEPDRRTAIFAVADAKPLILTEGESLSGWQIETITPTEVSLVSRHGTKRLQPTLDPNPPAPARAATRPAAAASTSPAGRGQAPAVAAGRTGVSPPGAPRPVAQGVRPPSAASRSTATQPTTPAAPRVNTPPGRQP
jgi:hypothetical protein